MKGAAAAAARARWDKVRREKAERGEDSDEDRPKRRSTAGGGGGGGQGGRRDKGGVTAETTVGEFLTCPGGSETVQVDFAVQGRDRQTDRVRDCVYRLERC